MNVPVVVMRPRAYMGPTGELTFSPIQRLPSAPQVTSLTHLPTEKRVNTPVVGCSRTTVPSAPPGRDSDDTNHRFWSPPVVIDIGCTTPAGISRTIDCAPLLHEPSRQTAPMLQMSPLSQLV